MINRLLNRSRSAELDVIPCLPQLRKMKKKFPLSLERAEILYRKIRASRDELEFRRLVRFKLGASYLALMRYDFENDADDFLFTAVFEVNGQKFKLGALSSQKTSNICDWMLSIGAGINDYLERQEKGSILYDVDRTTGELIDQEVSKRNVKLAENVLNIFIPSDDKKAVLNAMCQRQMDFNERICTISSAESLLGPTAVWINRDEFPAK